MCETEKHFIKTKNKKWERTHKKMYVPEFVQELLFRMMKCLLFIKVASGVIKKTSITAYDLMKKAEELLCLKSKKRGTLLFYLYVLASSSHWL